jgi:hypothetical protein
VPDFWVMMSARRPSFGGAPSYQRRRSRAGVEK